MKAINKVRLVCIANIETGEVIRIDVETAFTEFIYKKDSNWYFTTKSIYKQYIDSLKPNSLIPAPKFIKYSDNPGEKPELIHVFKGTPSMRRSKKKSSCNKKNKYRFQHTVDNTIKNSDGTETFRPARTIKHVK